MTSKNATKPKPGLHVAVRYADLFVGGTNTIAEHRKTLAEHGNVWFGKIGRGLGNSTIEALNTQIAESVPTYLYLVTRKDQGYLTFRGRIRRVQTRKPSDYQDAIPTYYDQRELTPRMGLWALLDTLTSVNAAHQAELFVATSGQPLGTTLNLSMAALFLIRRRNPPHKALPKRRRATQTPLDFLDAFDEDDVYP